jgi:hypothetical protein
MLDDARSIIEYLPNTFKVAGEGDYITFLWETFESNYQNEKYQFALLAYHMLYMSFFYFSVWQIKQSHTEDFKKSMIGFTKDDEKALLDASSPFAFWTINESRIFRFLKLIGCGNDRIGQFARLVQDRNGIAHSNGNIYFNNQAIADTKIAEVLTQIEAIQEHIQPIIHDCLRRFLIENWNPEEREYQDPSDQIREVLVHTNYFSQKDIEACLDFDISTLSGQDHFEEIRALFDHLISEYGAVAE